VENELILWIKLENYEEVAVEMVGFLEDYLDGVTFPE